MDTKRIHDAALAHGIVPQALDLVTTTCQAHFGDGTPSPVEVAAYVASLPTWTKVGMGQDTFQAMPSTWRMTEARKFEAPPERRRPTMRELTPAELASLEAEGLPRAEHIERARVLQQTPAP